MVKPPTSLPHIQVILGSTREGRFGLTVANWFMSIAAAREDIDAELIDLRDWPLPFFNHPKPPASGDIAPEARDWSAKVSEADGYVLITPEYNRGYPAVLKNALDHLYEEWRSKPVAFVGYGTSAGGARAIGQLHHVVIELNMIPVRNDIALVSAHRLFDDDGNLKKERFINTANALLDQLAPLANALAVLRSKG